MNASTHLPEPPALTIPVHGGYPTPQLPAFNQMQALVRHATGGKLDLNDRPNLSLNEICVEISRHHNSIWQDANERTAKQIASLEADLAYAKQRLEVLASDPRKDSVCIGDGWAFYTDTLNYAQESLDNLAAKKRR